MKRHERQAFLKFFFMYFTSVALLVLAAGFFYVQQIRSHLLKVQEFRLLEYARQIKMGGSGQEFGPDFSHRFVPTRGRRIDIRNFRRTKERFVKLIPLRFGDKYLEVSTSAISYDRQFHKLILGVVGVELLLLLLFALLSWRLACSALRPLEESVEMMDRFVKDLIHDLNTPLTAIRLNLTALEDHAPDLKDSRILKRLKQSADTVSQLHENLTVLLEEKTFQSAPTELCALIRETVELQRPLCPEIRLVVSCESFVARVHADAFRQILQNLLANACTYNRPGGEVRLAFEGRSLLIEDTGWGIEDPERIFERAYSAQGGSGLGLDIVRRLARAMEIEVSARRNETGGSTFILTMP